MMNKLEVLRAFRHSAKEARHEASRERYEWMVSCLLHGVSLWQEYAWHVEVYHTYAPARVDWLTKGETRSMRKYYRKWLATIAQALCWLGEWKPQQRQEGR